ncbi:MAG: LON peptidase substrate-binding domain-containing protein [Phycisphaerales bacterium]|nr:LON peptidase substrate-binding domain-containing protein [Phycisphaerales bacterium]
MSEEQSAVHVNFAKPMPLFPLDTATLLPQQILPLHIFEDRYRQMVGRALDGAGQIAMAVFRGPRWRQEYHGRPPLRPAVCVGQIMEHEQLPGGRYNIVLQGVCRARVVQEIPAVEGVLFRSAVLQPFGIADVDEESLEEVRDWLDAALSEGPLHRMVAAEAVLNCLRGGEIPTSTVIDVVSFMMTAGGEFRYRLLAEADALRRAEMVRADLEHLEGIIRRAEHQRPEDWPKGCSWN